MQFPRKFCDLRHIKTQFFHFFHLCEYPAGDIVHDHLAAVYDHHTFCLSRFFHIVGYQHDSHALLIEHLYGAHDLVPALWVEHSGRLVQQYAVGAHGDHACNGDTLFLSARQLVRCVQSVLIHTHSFKRIIDAPAYLGRFNAHILQRESHIFLNYGSNYLVIGVLEHHAHPLSYGQQIVLVKSVHAINENASRFGKIDGIDTLGKR